MSDAFDNIFGQPQVRDFLRATVSGDRISHAYLFTGPVGSNKTQAAWSFAQTIVCPKGILEQHDSACAGCDVCRRVMRKKHPDVHFYAPEGAGGYLVEQIREIVSDTALAPIQAKRKVYILDRVDLLGAAASNAFLKTLEEPPEDVVLILLGRTRESVLPTIVSRCQVVPFRHIPAHEAAGIVSQNTGATIALSRQAIEACGGSITRAVEFLRSPGNERLEFRSSVLQIMSTLACADDWDVILDARELLEKSKVPVDIARKDLEAEIAENTDFLAKSAMKRIEERNKRRLSTKTAEYLRQCITIIESWLRDVAMVCAGVPDLVINSDVLDALVEASKNTNLARLCMCLRATARANEAIAYNVSPETCLDVLLFEIREVLYGSCSTDQPCL